MKRFLPFLLLLAALPACNAPQHDNAQGEATHQTLSVDEFETILHNSPGAQLIDVRTPDEYAQGHLSNAVNIDYNGADFSQQIASLKKDQPVLVYCLSGGRSGKAADQLADAGFQKVYNLEGGILQWKNAGKPLDNTQPAAAPGGMTVADLQKKVQSDNYVLVDFGAKWCGPCQQLKPMLEALAENKKDKLTLLPIDADENAQLLDAKKIQAIPYLELYYKGQLKWTHTGLIDQETLLKETGL